MPYWTFHDHLRWRGISACGLVGHLGSRPRNFIMDSAQFLEPRSIPRQTIPHSVCSRTKPCGNLRRLSQRVRPPQRCQHLRPKQLCRELWQQHNMRENQFWHLKSSVLKMGPHSFCLQGPDLHSRRPKWSRHQWPTCFWSQWEAVDRGPVETTCPKATPSCVRCVHCKHTYAVWRLWRWVLQWFARTPPKWLNSSVKLGCLFYSRVWFR